MDNTIDILRLYRLHKRDTWKLFAARLRETKVCRVTIYNVLTGKTTPNETTLFQLERYYQAHKDEILSTIG